MAYFTPATWWFVSLVFACLQHSNNIRTQPGPPCRRYGHPTDRPHYASGLPPAAFEAVVCSYLQHGLAGTTPKVGGWSWEELQVGD